MPDALPLSYRYQQALAPLARLAPDVTVAKRLSEVLALLDFATTLNRSLELSEILDLVLFISIGETTSSWGAVALRGEDGRLRFVARRGSPKQELPKEIEPGEEVTALVGREDPDLPPATRALLATTGAEILAPLAKEARLIGLIALGPRPGGFGEGDRAFVEALSVAASASIDNGRIYEELRRVNNRLSLKVYQLNSLFDVTRELMSARDASEIRRVLLASAMGQLLAMRAAIVEESRVTAMRGLKTTASVPPSLRGELASLGSLSGVVAVKALESAALRETLSDWGLEVVVPLKAGSTSYGALLVGGKPRGQAVGEEDVDFLSSLAAQAAAAMENLRLTVEWIEKKRIEKELALAREIQRTLLPESDPCLPGWDIAAVNIPCYAVGGDYYDYVESSGGKLGLAIADVSGKGAGPALLMASAQASLRVLSQVKDVSLDKVFGRLNDLLYRSTGSSKYVTFFYALLDPASGAISYLNAGHCYPLRLERDGGVERLIRGGPVLGLFPTIDLEVGESALGPGEMLVMYTDGLSESVNLGGEEFGEARIIEKARTLVAREARDVVGELVGSVRAFAAGAGLSDDLTVMVVKRG